MNKWKKVENQEIIRKHFKLKTVNQNQNLKKNVYKWNAFKHAEIITEKQESAKCDTINGNDT